jgi:LytS/YehU family sensor histidine kinase
MLRGILSKDQQSMIPLWQEIEFVKNYLDIEEVRFQDRLTIDYNLDKSTENGLVPSFILQPLVENAIKHGFSKTITSGTITIQAFKEGDYMILKVSDDGAGTSLSPNEIEHHGIGLANVRDRLTILFGDQFVMEAIGKSNQGFNVSIKIPFQT